MTGSQVALKAEDKKCSSFTYREVVLMVQEQFDKKTQREELTESGNTVVATESAGDGPQEQLTVKAKSEELLRAKYGIKPEDTVASTTAARASPK